MLERFYANFEQDGNKDNSSSCFAIHLPDDIISPLGGGSFNEGLYRVHSSSQKEKWTQIVTNVFSQFGSRVECFGYDWLGRQFALDAARIEGGRRQVLMFQVGTGEAYEIPYDIVGFHDHGLVDLAGATLASRLHMAWRTAGNPAPGISQCAGYKVPPILNGRDEIENLMLIDMEVEWEITRQLLRAKSALPQDARIDNFIVDI